ncbi:hypothetical protein [Caenispirillum salinarum]|uniref:hypothetical protein n=1 Tax=Caenispirillum salinarum TaxID=859058 RepID=UPI00384FF237
MAAVIIPQRVDNRHSCRNQWRLEGFHTWYGTGTRQHCRRVVPGDLTPNDVPKNVRLRLYSECPLDRFYCRCGTLAQNKADRFHGFLLHIMTVM